jgi:hypothetical protein
MKFFTTISLIALSVSTAVSAVPIIEERTVTGLGTIGAALTTLQKSVTTSGGALSVSIFIENLQS